jgi:5-aminolevulinate synthase
MDYKAAFRAAVEQVKAEGRYRVFADLKRHRGDFPRATFTHDDGRESEITVWCSNE